MDKWPAYARLLAVAPAATYLYSSYSIRWDTPPVGAGKDAKSGLGCPVQHPKHRGLRQT